MAAAEVAPKSPSSFVYEELVSRVQNIRNQMIKFETILHDRCKYETTIPNELKSRKFTFIDPYGNRTDGTCVDHEPINNMIHVYKKDYIPRYLRKWIQIGIMKENIISSLSDFELKLAVSNYAADSQFISYANITVWIGADEYTSPHPFVLSVLLTDNMKKIRSQLVQFGQFEHIQLFSLIANQDKRPNKDNWNEGTLLNSEDTILSRRLYEDNCIILGKIGSGKVDKNF
jgi:hypothetical protein